MAKKTKLELVWVGKDKQPRLASQILLADPELSYSAKNRVTDNDIFDNMLIHGDNLLALKALEPDFSGKVNCIFIDPPYNTGNAFDHYDDGVEHASWLSLMRSRIEVLRGLLSSDGSIWIALDDNESHYFKVLCDEVFGRGNYLGSVIWQHSVQGKGYSGKLSVHHNYILGYRKSDAFMLRNFPRTDEDNKNYSNPDNDPRGPWRPGDVRNALVRPNLMYDITTPSGHVIKHPPKGWRFSQERFQTELASGKIKFSDDESRLIRKIYLADQDGRVPETVWLGRVAGTTRDANREMKQLGLSFGTPKPEALIQRILTIASLPGELVLDSFLGSGTTAAVAHKMRRRWIGVELGDHAKTHCIPRLKQVIDGTDTGGVSKVTGWKGGGGFRFYSLAPSCLEDD